KNRAKGMKIMRARLLEKKQEEQRSEIAATRKLMVGSGDRSERIRTYNFPQGRLTDHRINFTLYKLDRVMEGELDEVVEALITHYKAEAFTATGYQAEFMTAVGAASAPEKSFSICCALLWGAQVLSDAGIEIHRLDAEVLLRHVLKMEKEQLYMNGDTPIAAGQEAEFRALLSRRSQ